MTRAVLSPLDQTLASLDAGLRTLFAKPRAARATPIPSVPSTTELSAAQKRHAAGLMRVNHVGEVCAQALYTAQALTATTPELRAQMVQAAHEETDHLAWTAERLAQLEACPSRLNPLWYAGAFGLGLLAGRCGDGWSLGFVAETETQVEAHLASHLQNSETGLPLSDVASRAIVTQMQQDEAAHGLAAKTAGAHELPMVAKQLMAQAAQVMTRTAYWI